MTDADEKEIPDAVITPEQMEIVNIGTYQMLTFQQDPQTGGVNVAIVQVPVPIAFIEQFQEQFGEEMEKENLKLVVYKGKIFLAPCKTTSLVGF